MDFAVSFSSLLLFSAMFIWQPMQCDDMEEHSRPENKILMKAGKNIFLQITVFDGI